MSIEDIAGTHKNVVSRRMMLGKVVRIVALAFLPIDTELLMSLFVTKPIPSHIPCFRPTLLDVGMNKAMRGGVVCFEWRGRLRVAKSKE